MKRLPGLWVVVLLVSVSISTAQAPVIDGEYLKAQELEQQGNYTGARDIYKRLYETTHGDHYFWRLMLVYERLDDFKGMEQLGLSRLKNYPGEMQTMHYLAQAYYGLGDVKKARSALLEIIGPYWNDFTRIIYAAGELTSNNDFDAAIQVYTTAREKNKDNDLFSVELARLYLMKSEYTKAMDEYLKSIESIDISYSNIEQIIEDALAAGEKPENLLPPLENCLKQKPKSMKTARLLSGLKYRMGDYKGALSVLIEPSVGTNTFQDIWDIAGRLYDDGHLNEALSAYESFYRFLPENPNHITALLKSASIKAELGNRDGARQDYLTLAHDYRGTDEAAFATLRILELSKDTMTREGFVGALSEFAANTSFRKAALEALVLLAGTHMRDGKTDEAQKVLSQARVKARGKEEFYEIASQSALYYFYAGNFEPMAREIDACVGYVSYGNDINDLLFLKMLGLRCSTQADREGYTAFAHGKYALFRGFYDEAVDSLTFAARDSSSVTASAAAGTLAALYRERGDYDRAYAWYLHAATAAHDTTERVEAMIKAADIVLAGRNDTEGAKSLYMKAITSYPGTVYDSILRRKLRMVVEK